MTSTADVRPPAGRLGCLALSTVDSDAAGGAGVLRNGRVVKTIGGLVDRETIGGLRGFNPHLHSFLRGVVLFRLLWVALAALLVLPIMSPTDATQLSDRLYTTTAAGVPVRVISVNLADPRTHVTAQVAHGFPNGDESFGAMVARSRPTVAVNGAYFSKSSLKPIGDIVIHGRPVYEGMMGTALAVDAENRALIRRVRYGHAEDWSRFETVLGCGPALVLRGAVDVAPRQEGFRDPHVMGSTTRLAVGVTTDRHMLIVNTLAPVTFDREADVMRALGCDAAMNLDAGASLAMYYRGNTLISASRRLTNLLLVYTDGSGSDAEIPRNPAARSGHGTAEPAQRDGFHLPKFRLPRLPKLPRWILPPEGAEVPPQTR